MIIFLVGCHHEALVDFPGHVREPDFVLEADEPPFVGRGCDVEEVRRAMAVVDPVQVRTVDGRLADDANAVVFRFRVDFRLAFRDEGDRAVADA